MTSAGFEPAISAIKGLQSGVLDRTATALQMFQRMVKGRA